MGIELLVALYCFGVLSCLIIVALLSNGARLERGRYLLLVFSSLLSWFGVFIFVLVFAIVAVRTYREDKRSD